jgi:urease accessory protein
MTEPEEYTPSDTPPEFEQYNIEPPQMAVGSPGKVGRLRLLFEYDTSAEKTVLREHFSEVPLRVQRTLYLEDTLPSLAYVFLISPSEGILQGDRYRMDFTLRAGAQAHITTQSASKIYSMDANYATQLVNVSVDEGCYLEYVPDHMIPYHNARFYQRVDLRVHDRATLVYSEVITPGRVARGESFRYDVCALRTVAVNQDGQYRLAESMMLRPENGSLRGIGQLSDFDTLGYMYVLTHDRVSALNDTLNDALEADPVTRAGSTILARDSGVAVRVLGHSAEDVLSTIHRTVDLVRKAVLGVPYSGVHKR